MLVCSMTRSFFGRLSGRPGAGRWSLQVHNIRSTAVSEPDFWDRLLRRVRMYEDGIVSIDFRMGPEPRNGMDTFFFCDVDISVVSKRY